MAKDTNSKIFSASKKIVTRPAIAEIPQELDGLAREAGKYNSAEEFAETLGIPEKDIVWMKVFGSSVEGKSNPGDIDIFVAARDGVMRFPKEDELYNPIVKAHSERVGNAALLHHARKPGSGAAGCHALYREEGRRHRTCRENG